MCYSFFPSILDTGRREKERERKWGKIFLKDTILSLSLSIIQPSLSIYIPSHIDLNRIIFLVFCLWECKDKDNSIYNHIYTYIYTFLHFFFLAGKFWKFLRLTEEDLNRVCFWKTGSLIKFSWLVNFGLVWRKWQLSKFCLSLLFLLWRIFFSNMAFDQERLIWLQGKLGKLVWSIYPSFSSDFFFLFHFFHILNDFKPFLVVL